MTDAGEALDRPTILIVGRGERMQAALEQALVRHDIEVESVASDAIGDAAFAAAPDLLLLIGDAASDAGEAALAALEQQVGTSTVPVALLANEGVLEQPHAEFRHGIVAVIQRTASADGMAREIAALARDVPQRSGEIGGELGEAQIEELVSLFSRQLRTGILSVSADGESAASTQVVLRAGRPAADAIAELVERLRPLLGRGSGPLRYEFHESPAERIDLVDVSPDAKAEPEAFEGCRVLLVEQNPARADVLVQELRTAGALVVVADGEGRGLERARTHDPDVVIIDGSGMESWAVGALRSLRRDPRLRWASLLVVDAGELWPGGTDRPSIEKLSRSVHAMLRPDRDLAARAATADRFETRLELIGPARTLRALVRAGVGVKLTVRHPRARVEIDLAEGLVVGAQAFSPRSNEPLGEGPTAIAALLALGSGRVRVERRDAPATANLMSPLDDALAQAAEEPSPVSPSLPPPTPAYGVERPTSAPPTGSRDPEKLLARLEDLLERLGDVLPDAEAPTTKRGRVPRPGGVLPAVKPAIPPPARPIARGVATAPPPKRVGLSQTRRAPLGAPPSATPAPAPEAPKSVAPAVRPPWQRSSAPPAPDDDIPVIEATAEPGELTRAAEGASTVPPPTEPEPEPEIALPPPVPVIPGFVDPFASVPPPAAAPGDLKATLAMQAGPVPPPPAVAPIEEPIRLPASRLPLFLGIAAVLGILVVGIGGLAAWLVLGEEEPETTATLPGTAGGPTPTRTTPTPSPALPTPGIAPPPSEAAPTDEAAPAPEGATDEAATDEAGTDEAGTDEADTDEAGTDEADTDEAGTDEADTDEAGTDEAGTDEAGTDEPAAPEGHDAPADEAGEASGRTPRQRREEEVAFELRSGNWDRQQGRMREAEVHYLRVLRLSPRNVRALAGLARLALTRNDGTQAVRWASRLTAVAPRNPNNQVLLGDAYRAAGQRDNATRAYRYALELEPGHANATRRLGGR